MKKGTVLLHLKLKTNRVPQGTMHIQTSTATCHVLRPMQWPINCFIIFIRSEESASILLQPSKFCYYSLTYFVASFRKRPKESPVRSPRSDSTKRKKVSALESSNQVAAERSSETFEKKESTLKEDERDSKKSKKERGKRNRTY